MTSDTHTSLNPSEILLETFRSGIGCPVTVKITHTPTGTVARCRNDSEHRARKEAIKELEGILSNETK